MLHKKRGLEYSPKLLPSLLSISFSQAHHTWDYVPYYISTGCVILKVPQILSEQGLRDQTRSSLSLSKKTPQLFEDLQCWSCQNWKSSLLLRRQILIPTGLLWQFEPKCLDREHSDVLNGWSLTRWGSQYHTLHVDKFKFSILPQT